MASRQVSDDTALIMDAIQASNMNIARDIASIKYEISAVSKDMHFIKNEMASIKNSLHKVESKQRDLGTRIDGVEEKVFNFGDQFESVNNEIYSISYENDKMHDKMQQLERQIEMIERDKLKNSLRIFGLEELENENLVSEVKSKVLSIVGDEFNTGVVYARRAGDQKDQERMVIAKLCDFDTKLKLFQCRDELRKKGLRISNDLTYNQRQELKNLNARGYRGYYINGELHKERKTELHENGGTRVFRRAQRKQYDPVIGQHMEASQSDFVPTIDK